MRKLALFVCLRLFLPDLSLAQKDSAPMVSAKRFHTGRTAERETPEEALARLYRDSRFEHLGVDDGLSQGMITAMLQDYQGFLWFGTLDGLNKYDGHRFTNYWHDPLDSTSLSYNSIEALYEDPRGNLWVATMEGGINLYDRHTDRFHRFIPPQNDSSELYDNIISGMVADGDSALWIGTRGLGLKKLIFYTPGSYSPDNRGESVKHAKWIEYPGSPRRIYGLYRDSPTETTNAQQTFNALWIVSASELFRVSSPDSAWRKPRLNTGQSRWVRVFKAAQLSAFGLPNRRSIQDSNGDFWLGTPEGLTQFDRDAGTFILHTLPSGILKSVNYIFAVSEVPLPTSFQNHLSRLFRYSGRESPVHLIWMKTDNHLAAFNPVTQQYALIKTSFHHNLVSIYADRGGVLWLGTNGFGLYKFDPQSVRFSYPDYQTVTPETAISISTRRISMGYIWVDTLRNELWLNEGAKIYKANRKTNVLSYVTPLNYGASLAADAKGNLWAGASSGLYQIELESDRLIFHDASQLSNGERLLIRQVYLDRDDSLWCVIELGRTLGLSQFNRGSKQFRFFPFQKKLKNIANLPEVFQDESGWFWIAYNMGAICFDPEKKAYVKHYRHDPNDPQSLSSDVVTCIVPDPLQPQRYLWMSTKGGGLNRFDRHAETFTAFNTNHGLPNNTVYGILADGEGNLWMSTNKGLSRFDPQTESFRNFTVGDGLQGNEFNSGSFYKSPDGEMFFGGLKGFNSFYPEDIQDNPYLPPVVITDFQYYHPADTVESTGWRRQLTPAPVLETIELPYNANTLSFEFAALDYSAARNNQYAYKLEGLNDEWIYCGTERRANFSLIPPGHYVFRVKGTNSDGIWNEFPQGGTSVKVIIHPPWWRTWWAYALYAILALTFLYSLRRYEMSRQQLKHNLELEHVHAEKLEELDHLKSRFFANISHEFRTPLTLILGPLENLRAGWFKGDLDKQYGIMERNARKLLRLINQLLDLSKLEAGKLTLQASYGNLIPFVKGIVYSFESLAERKKIMLRFEAGAKEIMLYFDRDKMEKIVTNLLSNAFKFTPEAGKISVQLSVISDQSSQLVTDHCLLITIKDTGVGISAEKLPHVFERFYQAGESYTKDQQGSGIGLALTKELVELHHGEIAVASEAGKGTEFTVRLPLGKDQLAEDEIVESVYSDQLAVTRDERIEDRALSIKHPGSSIQHPATSDQTILIVEDNPDMRAYIRDQLSDMFQIVEAEDGEEGFEKSVDGIPDLIISDVMMPKMDGYQLCKKLKSDERTSHVPIILLTAKSSGESKLEGLELGADDYLIKPFDSRELQVRVKNLIDQRRKLRERFGKEIKLQPRDIAITSTDEKFLERAMAVVEEHISEADFDVETFGRKVGMSRKHLHRKLTALTDQTPSEFIRTLRLQRAAQMLERNAGNVTEVAYEVGFNSISHFAKAFKEQFGVLPSEFAKDQSR